jgi:hypothetical protein
MLYYWATQNLLLVNLRLNSRLTGCISLAHHSALSSLLHLLSYSFHVCYYSFLFLLHYWTAPSVFNLDPCREKSEQTLPSIQFRLKRQDTLIAKCPGFHTKINHMKRVVDSSMQYQNSLRYPSPKGVDERGT